MVYRNRDEDEREEKDTVSERAVDELLDGDEDEEGENKPPEETDDYERRERDWE